MRFGFRAEAAREPRDQEHKRQKEQGSYRAQIPKIVTEAFVDERADDLGVVKGHIVGYDVVGHRRKKNHGNTAHNPCFRKGERDLYEDVDAARAKILCRFQVALVDLGNRRIDGQDHEGQKVVDHTQDGVENIPAVRLVVDADPVQKLFQGVDAQNEVDPHGHDKQKE